MFRSKSDRHILTLRAACAWRSQKWWKTQQAIGTQAEPRSRRICDAQNPYWGHSQPGNKAKQWGDVFCFVFGLEWIEIIQECAKDQFKERRGHLFVRGVHLLGIKHLTKFENKQKQQMLWLKTRTSTRIQTLISHGLT